MKKNLILVFLFLTLNCSAAPALNYPNFQDNPFLTDEMRPAIAPHLLPLDHPMKETLDRIFSQSRVLENEKTLVDAGFEIIAGPRIYSYLIVARHPSIPGFVFKLYLDSETRCRKDISQWVWLVRRCSGAHSIRQIIKRKKIQHFVVPDKWLYVLPVYPFSSSLKPQPIILMETDMEPVSSQVSDQMWKTMITHKHLDELYEILKHGYGGHGVTRAPNNIPYTKQGKFAFTDTEDPQAKLKLKLINKYLSKKMQRYWNSLIGNSADE